MILDIINGSKLQSVVRLVGSRKRKVFLYVRDITETMAVAPPIGGWDGGSKDDAYKLEQGRVASPIPQAQAFGAQSVPTLAIGDDVAMITCGTFCGKPGTPSITCTQTYFDKWLKDN